MFLQIYLKAAKVVATKPFRLWGISLLSSFLTSIVFFLFGIIPGLALAINLAITTAMTFVFLRGYRGQTPKAADLLYCLKDMATAKRVVGGMLWMTLWIFLWALIPIVGPIFAIIKTYSYRLTPYILITEPNVPATEAIKVSQTRTRGYRGQMFLADFLVGIILAVGGYIVGFILGLLAMIPVIGVLFGLILFVFVLALIVLPPLFLGLVQAAFYEEIMGKLNSANK